MHVTIHTFQAKIISHSTIMSLRGTNFYYYFGLTCVKCVVHDRSLAVCRICKIKLKFQRYKQSNKLFIIQASPRIQLILFKKKSYWLL